MFNTLTNIATVEPTIASLAGFNDLVITLATGWTVTGIDLDAQFALPWSAAGSGPPAGTFSSPDDVISAIGYGTHGYTAPPLPTHLDDATLIWLGYPVDYTAVPLIPSTPTQQESEARSFHVRIRTQFRLPSEKDFYIQWGNMGGASITPQLSWVFRLHYE